MIKILHTADVHLDSPLRSLALRDSELRDRVQTASRTALTRIVDIAIAEDVAALLIAGDLFDGAERSARTAAFLTMQLERLRERGIHVFYIKGNHDAENPLTGEMSLPDNVHVFDGRGGKVQLSDDVWIHGVSFANRHAPESLLPKFPAPVRGRGQHRDAAYLPRRRRGTRSLRTLHGGRPVAARVRLLGAGACSPPAGPRGRAMGRDARNATGTRYRRARSEIRHAVDHR